MNPDIKGIISDMDGVILDTEKLYVRFWCEAANFYGYPMEPPHALSIRSMARPFAIAKLKGFFGEYFDYCKVHDKRIELMDKFISENGIESKPGAAEFLGFLKQNGYRVALATATAPERTKKYLSALGLYDYFDEIVCASMVAKESPNPTFIFMPQKNSGLLPKTALHLRTRSTA